MTPSTGHDTRTYVACLDCGTQLAYDLNAMRVGKALAVPPPVGAPEQKQKSANKTWYMAMATLAPVALIWRIAFKQNQKPPSDTKGAAK